MHPPAEILGPRAFRRLPRTYLARANGIEGKKRRSQSERLFPNRSGTRRIVRIRAGRELAFARRIDDRRIDEVFRDVPHVRFVRAQDLAHEKIVRPFVVAFLALLDAVSNASERRFVSVEKTLQHRGHVLRTVRRPWNVGQFGNVARIADGDSAEFRNSLRHRIREFQLLVRVLVEQEVKLIKRRAAHQPMVLLIKRVEDLRIRENAVEDVATLLAVISIELDLPIDDRSEGLQFDVGRIRIVLSGRFPRGTVGASFCGGHEYLLSVLFEAYPKIDTERSGRDTSDLVVVA
jgi:hypothetical protein